MTKWSSYKKSETTGSVHTLISNAHREEVLKNQNYLKCIIEVILYLSRQCLAFRAHREDDSSLNQGKYSKKEKLQFHKFYIYKKYNIYR